MQYRPVVASYDSSDKFNARLSVLQFVLLEGVDEVMRFILGMKIQDDPFVLIYMKLQPIHTFF